MEQPLRSPNMADCLFCKIINGDVPATRVRETDRVVAFRDIAPQAPTHVLVVPRVHYSNAVSLAEADPELLADLVKTAAAVAREENIAESGYRLVSNTGPDAGQTVFHVHLHLLGGKPLDGLAGSRPAHP